MFGKEKIIIGTEKVIGISYEGCKWYASRKRWGDYRQNGMAPPKSQYFGKFKQQ